MSASLENRLEGIFSDIIAISADGSVCGRENSPSQGGQGIADIWDRLVYLLVSPPTSPTRWDDWFVYPYLPASLLLCHHSWLSKTTGDLEWKKLLFIPDKGKGRDRITPVQSARSQSLLSKSDPNTCLSQPFSISAGLFMLKLLYPPPPLPSLHPSFGSFWRTLWNEIIMQNAQNALILKK